LTLPRLPLLTVALSAATMVILFAFVSIVRRNVEQTRSLREETDRVTHTLEVQRALDAVLYHVTEGDSAARGYLLAGGATPRTEYETSQQELARALERLQDLTRDNPAQQDRLEQLRHAIAVRLERLDQTIAIMQSSGREAALSHARETDAARARTDIRSIAEAMEHEEEVRLEGRRAQADLAYRQSVNGRVGSSIVSAVLLVAVVVLVLAHAHSSRRRELALITSERRARDAATREQEARTEAEQANRLKDEFLALLSHELRTPLNAVMGWTQILQAAGLTQPTVVRGLASIKRNAEAQHRLVEDLLDVSRIVTGKFPLERQPVDLRAAVSAAVETIRPAATTKNVRLTADLNTAVRVDGDAYRLQQVTTNLLSNALKFTPEGGQVDVWLATVKGYAALAVRDSGEGIAPELRPHIFDRFRQGDSSSTRAHGGLGLGLALAKHIVEAHGGTIEAHSEGPGRGSTFSVRIPAADSRPA
jgi:signal transduction histidine kinase